MPSTLHSLSEAEVDSNTEISICEAACLQQETDKALLNALAKRFVQEKLVNVGDQMFYVIQGAIIDLNSCKNK